MADISIQDDSGDKKYFTLVPNYVLNHSSMADQSLYLQMKRYAGENGKCTASEKTLMLRMKVGRVTFKKSLKYLTDHKWIDFNGESAVNTTGGIQKIKTYKVNDIWKLNTEFYQGVSETAPLTNIDKGVSETAPRGVQNDIQGVSRTAPNKNIYIENYNKIDTDVSSETKYGNNDVNETLSYLQEKLGLPELDGTAVANRRYAWNLIRKSKTGVSGVKWLIDKAAADPWWSTHITSVRDVWNNKVKIVGAGRGGVKVYAVEN